MWLMEIDLNKSCFVVRQHAGMPVILRGKRRCVGQTETGQLFEQEGLIEGGFGEELRVRVLTLVLDEPTTDGETEIVLLTNLPDTVPALASAEGYLGRWTIERAFGEITQSLNGEIATLAYPPAALLACAIAFVTYNMLSVVKTSIAQVHGEKVRDELSTYYMANEVAHVSLGMEIAIDAQEWKSRFAPMSAEELAAALKKQAKTVELRRYQKHRRGAKKPPTKRTGKKGHLSTARLLNPHAGKT